MGTPGRINLKPFVYLGLGLLAWWAVPLGIRHFFRDAFYEFQAPVILAQSQLQDLQRYWDETGLRSQRELLIAGRDLARANALLQLELQQMRGLAGENKRLEQLLLLPGNIHFRTVVARVARRDLHTWWQQLIVSKGSADGVREGSPVVINTGVVGRVTKVHLHTSEVELISSSVFRISANLDGDERTVVFTGDINKPFHPPSGRITYLPSDYRYPGPTNAPIQVFTSGTGGVFPAGLSIGVIEGKFVPTSDGLFLQAAVRLHTDLSRLEEVAVMIPLKPETAPPVHQ